MPARLSTCSRWTRTAGLSVARSKAPMSPDSSGALPSDPAPGAPTGARSGYRLKRGEPGPPIATSPTAPVSPEERLVRCGFRRDRPVKSDRDPRSEEHEDRADHCEEPHRDAHGGRGITTRSSSGASDEARREQHRQHRPRGRDHPAGHPLGLRDLRRIPSVGQRHRLKRRRLAGARLGYGRVLKRRRLRRRRLSCSIKGRSAARRRPQRRTPSPATRPRTPRRVLPWFRSGSPGSLTMTTPRSRSTPVTTIA